MIRFADNPPPMAHFYVHKQPKTTKVECAGNDGCPLCAINTPVIKKQYGVNTIDQDGRVSVMMMSAGNYEQMLGRIRQQTTWWGRLISWFKRLLRR